MQSEVNLAKLPHDAYAEFDEKTLVDALCRSIRDTRISYTQMRKVISHTVQSLLIQDWTLSEMFGHYSLIKTAIAKEMKDRYEDVLDSGFHAAAQSGALCSVFVSLAKEIVQASVSDVVSLTKHAYSSCGYMNDEEKEIARGLSRSKTVHWWWRNPERTGWFLVGPKGRFYPDFLARLTDGRLIVIEYKGRQLVGNPDTDDKEDLGLLWATVAGSAAFFYLVTAVPEASRPAQISPDDLARNVLKIAT